MWRTALLALLGACSLALSGPQPNRPRGTAPRCDTGKGMVVLDGLDATALGVTALALAGDHQGDGAVLPLALAAAFIGSAVHGSNAVDDCRREMDAYANETAPAPEPIAHAALPVPVPVPVPVPDAEPEPVPPVKLAPRPQPAAALKPAADDPWRDFWQEAH